MSTVYVLFNNKGNECLHKFGNWNYCSHGKSGYFRKIEDDYIYWTNDEYYIAKYPTFNATLSKTKWIRNYSIVDYVEAVRA